MRLSWRLPDFVIAGCDTPIFFDPPAPAQFADISCAHGSAADGFGEGFKLAGDIGSHGLVRDFGRTLRFERCDAVAPSLATERQSQLRQQAR